MRKSASIGRRVESRSGFESSSRFRQGIFEDEIIHQPWVERTVLYRRLLRTFLLEKIRKSSMRRRVALARVTSRCIQGVEKMQALDVATTGMAEAAYWPSMSDTFPYAKSRR
jgi:hypothetical protein